MHDTGDATALVVIAVINTTTGSATSPSTARTPTWWSRYAPTRTRCSL